MEDRSGVVLAGIEESIVKNSKEIFALLEQGSAKRRTAETQLNKQSSRSHSGGWRNRDMGPGQVGGVASALPQDSTGGAGNRVLAGQCDVLGALLAGAADCAGTFPKAFFVVHTSPADSALHSRALPSGPSVLFALPMTQCSS